MTQGSNITTKNKGGRPRKGTLEFRTGAWHARLTVTVDGVSVRKWFNLETDNKAVARRKLARALADNTATTIAGVAAIVAPPETYSELSKRVHARRRDEGIADVDAESQREACWVLDEIGQLPVVAIRKEHIAAIYENARAAGKSQSTLRNLRHIIRSRFAVALEEEIITSNPADHVRIPKAKIDRRERAVLTDSELAVYLGWQHPNERHRLAVLERQTMSALARVFGGLRTGDLHSMKWTGFDVEQGGFAWGIAPRKKTARPQRIAVPDSLRPILRDWWERQGKPTMGLLFPTLRGKRAGQGEKHGVSHAAAMRRDLQAAFTDYRDEHAVLGKDALDATVPAKDSARWRELFEETEETRPVDFHSWRRRFVQALADMGMNAQQAQKLAGHADLSAHERYLRSSARTLEIPSEALPDLSSRVLPHRWTKPSAPNNESSLFSARPAGLEPATSGLETHCSIQLSYGRKQRKRGVESPWFGGFVKQSATFGRARAGCSRRFSLPRRVLAEPACLDCRELRCFAGRAVMRHPTEGGKWQFRGCGAL
jgi:integrase